MRGLTLIRSLAPLPGAYPGPLTMNIPTGDSKWVYLYIGYTLGAGEVGCGIQFYVEWSKDKGTTWFRNADWETDSDGILNGAVTMDKNSFLYSADSTAPDYDYIVVPLRNQGNAFRCNFLERGVVNNYGQALAYLGMDR